MSFHVSRSCRAEASERRRIRHHGISALLLLGLSLPSLADDWPEWGGQPMRNMYSPAKNLPSSIGKIEFKPGTEEIQTKGVKNLKFALKIGSQSYGNVTVAK